MLRTTIGTVVLLLCFTFAARAQFTDWSEPVNLGPVVNSPDIDSCVAISKNGLSLFFSSTRGKTSADRDLYVSKRDTVDEDWGLPQPLTTLNTTVSETCPCLSLDEHRLFFSSPGNCGGNDLWVSRRQDRRENALGWELPVNLGCADQGYINSNATDQTPAVFEDESGRVLMYFASGRGGPTQIYQSEMREDDTFGPATPVAELNSSIYESGPVVRRDGLEVIFQSRRPTGGYTYFWVATRASTKDPWSAPELVTSLGRGTGGRIALSFDGRELYFTSNRSGNTDLYVARRERLKGGGDAEK